MQDYQSFNNNYDSKKTPGSSKFLNYSSLNSQTLNSFYPKKKIIIKNF